MEKPLPEFRKRQRQRAEKLLTTALSHGERHYLRELIEYEDGHYRAIFDPAYFTAAEGRAAPSKSQWNTLKKRLKRHDEQLFIFKEHGETADGSFYLDFGFFAH